MFVLVGVLAYTGLFLMVEPSSGVALAFTLAMSSVMVGTLASLSRYTTWYQKSLWLLAFLVAFISLPGNLEASRELLPELPPRLRDLWLVVVIMSVPVGILTGILRTWRWTRT